MRNIETRLTRLEANGPAGNVDMIDVIVLQFVDKNGPCKTIPPLVMFASNAPDQYRKAFKKQHPDYQYR